MYLRNIFNQFIKVPSRIIANSFQGKSDRIRNSRLRMWNTATQQFIAVKNQNASILMVEWNPSCPSSAAISIMHILSRMTSCIFNMKFALGPTHTARTINSDESASTDRALLLHFRSKEKMARRGSKLAVCNMQKRIGHSLDAMRFNEPVYARSQTAVFFIRPDR